MRNLIGNEFSKFQGTGWVWMDTILIVPIIVALSESLPINHFDIGEAISCSEETIIGIFYPDLINRGSDKVLLPVRPNGINVVIKLTVGKNPI